MERDLGEVGELGREVEISALGRGRAYDLDLGLGEESLKHIL